MSVPRKYTDRDDVEVQILAALIDRPEEGLTVFELRTHVGADIDAIEDGLAALKADDLIDVDDGPREGASAVIKPANHVVTAANRGDDASAFQRIRERLPF